MKKILLSILIATLIFITHPKCKGSFDVEPRELFISMDKDFIKGNTSKIIKVINADENEINISWYLDNPSPGSIRPNRTTIPNLSWIYLEPKWQNVSWKSNYDFFIYLNIPQDKKYINQHWEVWITFKEEGTSFIKLEHAVRLYIDTPGNLDEENNIPIMSVFVFIILISIVFLVIFYLYKKKKKYPY